MDLGFTGTQNGMTPEQAAVVVPVLAAFITEKIEVVLHHGDCIGADEEMHQLFQSIAVDLQFPSGIVVHPPENPAKRAFTATKYVSAIPVEVRGELPYMTRNEEIIRECGALLACPAGRSDMNPRSGTWATVRRALNIKGYPVCIVHPDGALEGRIATR